MYTSERLNRQRLLHSHGLRLLFAAAFTALFGAIYERFSFGVWSFWMVYAFLPFLLGGIWLLVLPKRKALPGELFLGLLEPGLVMLTLGSILAGVVEIYGTENRLLSVLPIAGGVLILASAITRVTAARRKRLPKNVIRTTSNIYTHLDYSSKVASANAILSLLGPTEENADLQPEEVQTVVPDAV